jgi:hypothetical protein
MKYLISLLILIITVFSLLFVIKKQNKQHFLLYQQIPAFVSQAEFLALMELKNTSFKIYPKPWLENSQILSGQNVLFGNDAFISFEFKNNKFCGFTANLITINRHMKNNTKELINQYLKSIGTKKTLKNKEVYKNNNLTAFVEQKDFVFIFGQYANDCIN